MSEVKIKNITVEVDGQDFSFSARSVAAVVEYDPATDPEVQGKSLEDVSTETASVALPVDPATSTETVTVPETPTEPVDAEVAAPAAVEPAE